MSVPDIISAEPAGFTTWREAFVRDFGLALSGVVQVVDPDVIVLGGGLSNIPFLYDMGAAALHQNTLQGGTPVLRNMLGDSAGVVGAALLGAGAE
jgi:fructokinase